MIRIDSIAVVDDGELELGFNDGSTARWSVAELLIWDTEQTRALRDPEFFKRAFVKQGALAWPNGLELSAVGIHTRLKQTGQLDRQAD